MDHLDTENDYRLTLKDIQDISLDILSDVHHFCMENGIRYSLAYGTLIGAIRHHGFIPWDDDADIMMPRADYLRFCQTYRSDRFRIISEYDADSYIQYARIYDCRDTRHTSYAVRSKNPEEGVWIDVFPLDGAEDDHEAFLARIKKMYRLRLRQVRLRDAKADISKAEDVRKKLRLLGKKIIYLNGAFLRLVNRCMFKTAQEIPFGSTAHWSSYTSVEDGHWEYQLTEDFTDTVPVIFEGREFRMCNGYDRVLRNYYGDYTQLPPKEEQEPKHVFQSFIWKSGRRPLPTRD